jgi:IS605 OrfB family transposase
VTSVNINFLGSRARVGFQFDVLHQKSRVSCPQDEIDELRSRRFPRHAQDQEFLESARSLILESFGESECQLRVLAVDLGEAGAQAAVYQGRRYQADVPLRIVKIDQCYSSFPEVLKKDELRSPPPKFPKDRDTDWRGLRKEHVGHHLGQLNTGAEQIAIRRQEDGPGLVTLRDHDFRGLTRHVQWMIRDWARHNASQIIAVAQEQRCDLIVFESLRGFRPRGYDQMDPAQKRRLAFFAYGQVRHKVVEKAVERGMRVVTVPYGYSSQICSACGHQQQHEKRCKDNKKNRQFECECGDPKAKVPEPRPTCRCTAKLNSDANAARVLARVFWGEINLPARHAREPAIDSTRPST